MNPREQNLMNTLNLLTLLHRDRKIIIPKLPEEEEHTLTVTKEHLQGAGLTIPIFINTLETLAEKGYLAYVPMHEQKTHAEVQKFLSDPTYLDTIEKLRKSETTESKEELLNGIGEIFENTIPKNFSIDKQGLAEEQITLTDLFELGLSVIKDKSTDTIAVVVLMPFRTIERLLKKMNTGMKFEDVQDAGLWYDEQNHKLHFGEEEMETIHQNEPSKVHFVFDSLFNQTEEPVIDYSSNTEFNKHVNPNEENKRFYYSLNHFMKKYPQLTEVFEVHADRLEIKEAYREHIH